MCQGACGFRVLASRDLLNRPDNWVLLGLSAEAPSSCSGFLTGDVVQGVTCRPRPRVVREDSWGSAKGGGGEKRVKEKACWLKRGREADGYQGSFKALKYGPD